MKKKALRSKRNRHTGRINAAKQHILDASAPLISGKKGVFQGYVDTVIGNKAYKGIRTQKGVNDPKFSMVRDTVTWVRTNFNRG